MQSKGVHAASLALDEAREIARRWAVLGGGSDVPLGDYLMLWLEYAQTKVTPETFYSYDMIVRTPGWGTCCCEN